MEALVTKEANTATKRTTVGERLVSITEILEKILLALPNRKLLLAQQVSKTWLSTIKNSHQIQKALCLKAMGPSDDGHHKTSFASLISNNFDRPELCDAKSAQEYLNGIVLNRYHVNPMVERFLEVASLDHEYFDYCTTQYKFKDAAPTITTKTSAVNTFLTQPPTTTIQFQCCQDLEDYDDISTLSNPDGITVLDFVAEIQAKRRALGRAGRTSQT